MLVGPRQIEAALSQFVDPVWKWLGSIHVSVRTGLQDDNGPTGNITEVSSPPVHQPDRTADAGYGEPSKPEAPVRVVHLIGRLSRTGGVQVVVRRLAASVDPNRIDLHIVTMRPAWDDVSDVPARVHHLGFGGSRYRLRDRVSIMWNMTQAVRRLRPDVVQIHSGMAWLGLLARLSSPTTPFVLEVHDAPGSGRHGAWTDRFEGWCIRWLPMTAICHSSQVATAVASYGAPARKISQFPLAADTESFRPRPHRVRNAWRADNGFDPDTPIAVAVGRPANSKRIDLLVDAFAQVLINGADLRLLLVGCGDSPQIHQQVDHLGLSDVVLLSSQLSDAEMPIAIASCDILCSTSEYEGFGLTIIEGMASGLPVVAMAVGGVRDLVSNDETGFLVPSGNTTIFTDRLRKLADSPSLRSRLGAASRLRAVERYGIETMAESFTEVYNNLGSDTRHRASRRTSRK